MSLEEKLNRLNKNVFGNAAKEIRIEPMETNHLEDDFPLGKRETNTTEQEHDVDG